MSECIICNSECPLPAFKRKWPNQRKYCSSKCTKTAYRQRHPDKNKQSQQKWLENNPDIRSQSSSKYYFKNKDYYYAKAAVRVSRMKEAKLASLTEWDLFYIEEFYDLARRRGLEVDHIIPIQHELVCGLHVPENLQMLTRKQNASKSNKFNPEDVVAIFKD